MSGCSHRCKGCFNPELWNHNNGKQFGYDTIREIVDLCSKDYISGLSLLGGEPLDPENILNVSALCSIFKGRYPNKTIWCYTGYTWEDIRSHPIMKHIDVLVDGKFVEKLKDPRLRFRGSSNQRIIDVRKSLETDTVFLRKDLME